MISLVAGLVLAAGLESDVRAEMARRAIPGLAAAVVQDGKVVWSGVFGLADLENRVPVTRRTVFRFASVSKPITAVAALRLVEDGRLALDQPARTLIPELPAALSAITVRHLLAHQSGIPHHQPPARDGLPHHARVSDAFLARAAEPLLFEPGARFGYSTHAYSLLGWVMEAASRRRFAEELRASVFVPARMTTARTDDLYEVIPHRAQGYFRSLGGELRNSQPMDPSDRVPGGGLCGTILDLAAFAAALQGDGLLPKPARARMWTPQRLADGSVTGYGLGWYVDESEGRLSVHHGGTQPRTSGILYLLPDESLAVAVLANLEQVDHRPLARRLAEPFRRRYLGLSGASPRAWRRISRADSPK
jgi:serine beta-lactamase-like protein LACTB, mitochondrial